MNQIKFNPGISISIFVTLSFALFGFDATGQSSDEFRCPVNGTVIINSGESLNKENQIEALRFKSIDGNVFSSSDGTVISIDSVNNHLAVFIQSGKYRFSYHDLDSTKLRVGDKIKVRTLVGRVSHYEVMILLSKKGKLLTANKIHNLIRCD